MRLCKGVSDGWACGVNPAGVGVRSATFDIVSPSGCAAYAVRISRPAAGGRHACSKPVHWTPDAMPAPVEHVRVDHSGAQILVSKKLLDGSHVVARLQ